MKKKVTGFLEGLPWYVKNVYFTVLIFFLLWMMLFDKYNLYSHFKFSRKLNQLQGQKEYFVKEIKEIEALKIDLFSTNEYKERFARERYKMKKDNEDIFIIVER
jgi:cell division protein DivIC